MDVITLKELEKITNKHYTKALLKSMIGSGWYLVGTKNLAVTRKTVDDKKYFIITINGLNHEENQYLVRC